ncbi:MAG: 6-phosphogluconolactonase [Bacteroidales bacterium]
METKIIISENAVEACTKVATRLSLLAEIGGSVALSGGNTPKLLFKIMAEQFANTNWSKLKFFWGDERMVCSSSAQSNYGEFYKELIISGIITKEHVFATNYFPNSNIALQNIESKIKHNIPYFNGLPRFNLILLGVGEDGHIASIFPNNLTSFTSKKIVEITRHPTSMQERITLTGSTINNAREVLFLCTGGGKKEIIHDIIINKNINLPATNVLPQEKLEWYIDTAAAQKLRY